MTRSATSPGGGLVLGEVQSPDLVRARPLLRERRLAALSELAAFPMVVRRQQQALVAQQPQHGRLRHPVPVMSGHRPDLPMTPRRMRVRVPDHDVTGRDPGRPRPWTFRRPILLRLGLQAPPRALGHVKQIAEPRSRHARLDADHLEVLEGRNRHSALFFHTRISTAVSPSACVSSATLSSSCCSRVEGLDLPASMPALPTSRN